MSSAIESTTRRRRLAAKIGTGLACLAAVATLLGAPKVEAQRHGHRARHQVTSSTSAGAPTGHVNINTASAEELRRLPGIGPSKADAILALRHRVHRFRRIEEVMRVRGIGRATFRHLRSLLAVDGPTTLTAPPSRHRSPRAAAQ